MFQQTTTRYNFSKFKPSQHGYINCEKYTQDLSNLPLEVRHLLEEIKSKDVQVSEARKRYQTRDHQLHKFIRTNGTLTKHPKEDQLYSKIEEDMKLVQKLQKENSIG